MKSVLDRSVRVEIKIKSPVNKSSTSIRQASLWRQRAVKPANRVRDTYITVTATDSVTIQHIRAEQGEFGLHSRSPAETW